MLPWNSLVSVYLTFETFEVGTVGDVSSPTTQCVQEDLRSDSDRRVKKKFENKTKSTAVAGAY